MDCGQEWVLIFYRGIGPLDGVASIGMASWLHGCHASHYYCYIVFYLLFFFSYSIGSQRIGDTIALRGAATCWKDEAELEGLSWYIFYMWASDLYLSCFQCRPPVYLLDFARIMDCTFDLYSSVLYRTVSLRYHSSSLTKFRVENDNLRWSSQNRILTGKSNL